MIFIWNRKTIIWALQINKFRLNYVYFYFKILVYNREGYLQTGNLFGPTFVVFS